MRRLAHIGALLATGLFVSGCFLAHGQDDDPSPWEPPPEPTPTPEPEPHPPPEPEPPCTVFAIPGPRIHFEDLSGEGTCGYGEIPGGGASLTAIEPAHDVNGITIELQRFTREWPPYHCRFTISDVGADLADRIGAREAFVSGEIEYQSARLTIPLDCFGPGCEDGTPVLWVEASHIDGTFGGLRVRTDAPVCVESSPGCFDMTFDLLAGDPTTDFAAVLREGEEAAIDGAGRRWVRALRTWFPDCGSAEGAFVFFREDE